jgi:phage shock protein C
MAERTKQMGQSSNLGDSVSYTENDLQLALDDFLEEEKRKEVKPTLFNFQTIAGFVIIFLSLSYLVQQIGLSWGPSLSGLMSALPVIGGVIVTIVGLGIFSRERKKHRKQRRKERREKKHLYNNLEQRERRRAKHRKHEFDSFKSMSEHDIKVDRYALKKNKKLFRSRHDKRIFGVCGGIARYFGVSSTFVRLLFAIGTLLGYGFPIILYIALAVVLPKEPYSLFDVDDI